VIRDEVEVIPIEDKMWGTRFGWLGHMKEKQTEALVMGGERIKIFNIENQLNQVGLTL